jgi:Flp pilus assembly protein TadD
MNQDKLSFDQLYQLGKRYFETGRYHEAQAILREALLVDASRAEAHNLYGMALGYDPARRQLAESFFVNAIQLDGKNIEYRRNLAALGRSRRLSERAMVLLYGSNAELCAGQLAINKTFASFREQKQAVPQPSKLQKAA